MSLTRRAVIAAVAAAGLAGCDAGSGSAGGAMPESHPPSTPSDVEPPSRDPRTGRRTGPGAAAPAVTRATAVARYGSARPTSWGFDAPGVLTVLPRSRRGIALTFDACGGPGGSGYDKDLIGFLRARKVPATLFLNSRWIDAHPAVFRELADDPLFEIANHGTRHRPLSVSGRSAYGIPGTRDAGEVFDEVAGNHTKLTGLLGRPPRWFRSGTAYYDDVASRVVSALGERPVSFTVNGDGGATFTPGQVHTTVTAARPGSIVIGHMNRPTGGTAEGIATAVPRLLASGHRFVRLSDAL
ncbi:polysaccharide deacetylase family protein [Streptomyces sp. NBC_00859]|uniref:polysaccharide deacetylase family protein n=1 Tax=Streptomyces sp. NBC_00859 TaxID=2903682 RepID=UPI00386E3E06|nr:polysaccharide deacetylase family protein [Streptomyces sp. NBC_00859]